jgi:hypothetical protein
MNELAATATSDTALWERDMRWCREHAHRNEEKIIQTYPVSKIHPVSY